MTRKRNLEDITKQIECRYGTLTLFTNDSGIGHYIEHYGEWAQLEIEFLCGLIDSGAVVLDIGAYIGTHTISFCRKVGPQGRVYSFEPRPEYCAVLRQNIESNKLGNAEILQKAVSGKTGFLNLEPIDLTKEFTGGAGLDGAVNGDGLLRIEVPIITIDDLGLDRCDLIKIDVEGMETDVLGGGISTLNSLRPIIAAECFSVEAGWKMIEFMRKMEYHPFFHFSPAFNPDNFNASKKDLFGGMRDSALIMVPKEKYETFLAENYDNKDLIEIENQDDLVLGLLKQPYYKYETLANTAASKIIGTSFFAVEPELAGYKEREDLIMNSWSWRLTKPLRAIGSLYKRIFKSK
jgi:FkbM family methyltransferase